MVGQCWKTALLATATEKNTGFATRLAVLTALYARGEMAELAQQLTRLESFHPIQMQLQKIYIAHNHGALDSGFSGEPLRPEQVKRGRMNAQIFSEEQGEPSSNDPGEDKCSVSVCILPRLRRLP